MPVLRQTIRAGIGPRERRSFNATLLLSPGSRILSIKSLEEWGTVSHADSPASLKTMLYPVSPYDYLTSVEQLYKHSGGNPLHDADCAQKDYPNFQMSARLVPDPIKKRKDGKYVMVHALAPRKQTFNLD
jgi:hypothetical protein